MPKSAKQMKRDPDALDPRAPFGEVDPPVSLSRASLLRPGRGTFRMPSDASDPPLFM